MRLARRANTTTTFAPEYDSTCRFLHKFSFLNPSPLPISRRLVDSCSCSVSSLLFRRCGMRVILIVLSFMFLTGCATAVRQSAVPLTRYDKNTKCGIERRSDGFGISVYYSRYQFIPESDVVATACKAALTSIAWEYAEKQGKEITPINEQRIRLSMGRNGLTGITSCSAFTTAKWK